MQHKTIHVAFVFARTSTMSHLALIRSCDEWKTINPCSYRLNKPFNGFCVRVGIQCVRTNIFRDQVNCPRLSGLSFHAERWAVGLAAPRLGLRRWPELHGPWGWPHSLLPGSGRVARSVTRSMFHISSKKFEICTLI